MHRLEKKIGYSVTFTHIPDTWINGWMTFSMERSWRKHGIKATGVNYFTFGALVNGLSSRFIRNEKQYQSWLGAYLVKFSENKEFTLQDHYDLAIADQKNWLGKFGDPQPFIEMLEQHTASVEDFAIGKYNGKLYETSGSPSHSDVGSRSNNNLVRIIMALMASMFNKNNRQLSLKSSNFIPTDLSANYETVTLKGYIAIIELANNTKVVLYGNGAIVNGGTKEEVNHYLLLKQDILTAFKAVKVTEVN